MYRKAQILFLLLFAVQSFLPDTASAWPFRWRRTKSYSSSSSGGLLRVAPKMDADSSGFRPLAVHYSYNHANSEDVAFADKIRVFMLVRDEAVLEAEAPVVAEVKLTDVSDTDATRTLYYPVSLSTEPDKDYKLGVIDVVNSDEAAPAVKPAKVYRLFVNLHRQSQQYGKDSVFGRVPTPYYVATSGNSRIERARRHVAMRTFKEFYYTERGWRPDEPRPLDCHAFYLWATGSCTVGSQSGRTMLGRLFGSRFPYRNGGHIPELAQSEPLHADYVRIPGHTFMVLAYDAERGHVWTMESNFNRTIEVAIRSVTSGWQVGHLEEDHITPGLFTLGAE